jgi:hypothetical protein
MFGIRKYEFGYEVAPERAAERLLRANDLATKAGERIDCASIYSSWGSDACSLLLVGASAFRVRGPY